MVASNDTWTEILDNSPSSGPEVAAHCPDAIYSLLLSEARGRGEASFWMFQLPRL